MGGFPGSRRIMPVSRPSFFSRRVTGNCLSTVGCGVPYDGLTDNDLAGGEVADAEGSSRVVSVDAEHDVLGPAWCQLVLGFGSLQVSVSSKWNEVIKRGPVSDPKFVWRDTGVEGGCRGAVAGVVHGFRPKVVALVCVHTS